MKIWKIETGKEQWLWIDELDYELRMIKIIIESHYQALKQDIPDDLTITEVIPESVLGTIFPHEETRRKSFEYEHIHQISPNVFGV